VHNRRVKYWQIIIENLRNAGWNCSSMTTTDRKGRAIWVVAAEQSDAGRIIVRPDEKQSAFVELESAVRCARPSGQSNQLLSQKAKRTNANTEKHHGGSALSGTAPKVTGSLTVRLSKANCVS
jgi:hypothetical protein